MILYPTSFYINGEHFVIFGMTVAEKMLTNWCLLIGILNAIDITGNNSKDLLLSDRYPRCSAFYTHPIPKQLRVIQWRISHGAVANRVFRYNAGFSRSSDC
jgi:hypothetical protein